MSGVFANGLEISGKAVNAQTIAAFPDTCFTPPENPATPPGVPVPYPSFGMASDTENGTGTVFICGKTVNIKNKSDVSRTSGTEAGCAAKKGIITSKNTGKKYFTSWSNDVKFDGEPVIRFSDLATHNHASPGGQTPPFPEICAANQAFADCVTLLNELGMQLHEHGKSPCENPNESEHYFENQMMQTKRKDGRNYKPWKNYSTKGAPCVCMQSWHRTDHSTPAGKDGPKKGTPHNLKTTAMRDFLEKKPNPTLGEAIDETKKAYGEHDPRLKKASEEKKEQALECLELILLVYLQSVAEEVEGEDGKSRPPTHAEMRGTTLRDTTKVY
ncbi:DUF4150 domain-containing protein [Paracoccus versutus]|uniref:Uncharacterized protein DUF4150 n=1 Tax=Paracoccus versutus TaxID=34007 RepID=A0AAQ0HKL8_PARVE|nr:DUF4150 domain-containing protein [Paracoccus versutus]KGJ09331.1 hypothetical protein IT40_15855 [Paracoccus versutus]REG52481.1 uncharacterized protein DUF4150 [Paracoccus versutus]WEJ78744.1 DUF4150 domain-containing protein [Paracoccus versutus]